MLRRLTSRPEWRFFGALFKAAPGLATAWWVLLIGRGVLPALLAIASGTLIGAVTRGDPLTGPLVFVGIVFVLLQVLTPLQQSIGVLLGARTASHLNDRLLTACTQPPGMTHLERADLMDELTVARDFDLGITGPPLHISMDFIAGGLVQMAAGLATALVLIRFAWWAPIALILAWGSTHWLLRESSVWRDRNTPEVRHAQRHADYAYRLAVDAPAAKELRLFGLADWVVDRFATRRQYLRELHYRATRLREAPVIWCLLIVAAANAAVFWALADAAADGRIDVDQVVVFLQTAIGASAIAFGGLNWALDGAAAPVAAVAALEPRLAEAGALSPGTQSAAGMPAREIRFNGVRFAYATDDRPVLDGFDLTIPAGTSLAIVGQNGAGKTTLAKLLCRLYDPQAGSIEIDGVDLRQLDLAEWRHRIAAVFQDFVRYELPLRANVAPAGATDADVMAALLQAGAGGLAELDTILAKGYPGGTDLSGGQWQRVALARAMCAVRLGAGLVVLDEPTAQLDVRGEAEIFERILDATKGITTILVSHRFGTVRRAQRICVLEKGRVVELGSHDELMALNGRYRTMFDLQASRFVEVDDEGKEVEYETLG